MGRKSRGSSSNWIYRKPSIVSPGPSSWRCCNTWALGKSGAASSPSYFGHHPPECLLMGNRHTKEGCGRGTHYCRWTTSIRSPPRSELGLLQLLLRQGTCQRTSLYTNTIVLFLRPTVGDLQFIQEILRGFGEASCLVTNISKSSITPIQCSQ